MFIDIIYYILLKDAIYYSERGYNKIEKIFQTIYVNNKE